MMEVMLARKAKMSELCEGFDMYPQALINVRVNDKKVILSNEDVKKVIEEVSTSLGSKGRLLVRESGTEPVIRVMVEAESQEVCNNYANKVVDVIKQNN